MKSERLPANLPTAWAYQKSHLRGDLVLKKSTLCRTWRVMVFSTCIWKLLQFNGFQTQMSKTHYALLKSFCTIKGRKNQKNNIVDNQSLSKNLGVSLVKSQILLICYQTDFFGGLTVRYPADRTAKGEGRRLVLIGFGSKTSNGPNSCLDLALSKT